MVIEQTTEQSDQLHAINILYSICKHTYNLLEFNFLYISIYFTESTLIFIFNVANSISSAIEHIGLHRALKKVA